MWFHQKPYYCSTAKWPWLWSRPSQYPVAMRQRRPSTLFYQNLSMFNIFILIINRFWAHTKCSLGQNISRSCFVSKCIFIFQICTCTYTVHLYMYILLFFLDKRTSACCPILFSFFFTELNMCQTSIWNVNLTFRLPWPYFSPKNIDTGHYFLCTDFFHTHNVTLTKTFLRTYGHAT